jgi:hypothetical protein
MDPEDLILLPDFSLYDAMTALEVCLHLFALIYDPDAVLQIGDPRMDTGIALDEQRRPPFDPLKPLLPEELCYVLDRSLAAEVRTALLCALKVLICGRADALA